MYTQRITLVLIACIASYTHTMSRRITHVARHQTPCLLRNTSNQCRHMTTPERTHRTPYRFTTQRPGKQGQTHTTPRSIRSGNDTAHQQHIAPTPELWNDVYTSMEQNAQRLSKIVEHSHIPPEQKDNFQRRINTIMQQHHANINAIFTHYGTTDVDASLGLLQRLYAAREQCRNDVNMIRQDVASLHTTYKAATQNTDNDTHDYVNPSMSSRNHDTTTERVTSEYHRDENTSQWDRPLYIGSIANTIISGYLFIISLWG